MTPVEANLLEQVTSAHRERDVDGAIKTHPAWLDLDRADRVEAFNETLRLRALERALDHQGQSTTVKELLNRINGSKR